MRPLLLWITLVSCLLHSTATIASEHSATAAITKAVNDFVYAETRHLPGKVTITVKPNTYRAAQPCNQLQPFLPPGGRLWGKFSVGVRCQNEETSWTLYVPVEIAVIASVVHAAQPINRGQIITAQDIVSKEANLVRIPNQAITDPVQVISQVATAYLASGQPIRAHQIRAQYVISRGQKVQLIASGTGFSVSTEGEALAAAAEGEMVQVRNLIGRIISGIARQGGIVEIRQ